MIRIAAVGDVHVGRDSTGCLAGHFAHVGERSDLLLLAGDLTKRGLPEEAEVLSGELAGVDIPVVAVLGNHDYESGCEAAVTDVLSSAGIVVLEGATVTVDVDGSAVGVAGVKGFGGGFAGACGTEFGEPEMKAFIRHSTAVAESLEAALASLNDVDARVALTHYAPVDQTLHGERLEIYPFLGSYLLAEAIDHVGADLAVHGHAHGGAEKGVTPGGVPVRNVAQPVLRRAYAVLCVGGQDDGACVDDDAGEPFSGRRPLPV